MVSRDRLPCVKKIRLAVLTLFVLNIGLYRIKKKFSTCAKSSSVTKSATAIFLSFSKVGVISGMRQNLTKIFHRMKAFLCLLLQMFIATTKCMEEGHCSIPTRLYQHLLWFHELVYIGKVFIFRVLSTTSQHLPTDQKL